MSITFVPSQSAPNRHHHRCDVAVFLGYVARREQAVPPAAAVSDWFDGQALPAALTSWWQTADTASGLPLDSTVRSWLRSQHLPSEVSAWLAARYVAPTTSQHVLMQELGVLGGLNASHGAEAGSGIPWRCDTWDQFASRFAWDQRPIIGSERLAVTSLGAAVANFFQSGGASCWIIPLGAPPPVGASLGMRAAALDGLLAGKPDDRWSGASTWRQLRDAALPTFMGLGLEVSDWRGREHLVHLDDAAMFLLPDLGDLLASELVLPEPVAAAAPPRERFWPCPEPLLGSPGTRLRSVTPPTPHLDPDARYLWRRIVRECLAYVQAVDRRDLSLLAALPLAVADTRFSDQPEDVVNEVVSDPALANRQLQLCWPWLQPIAQGGNNAPQDPIGLVAGVLARGAREQGAFRSIGGLALPAGWRMVPEPDFRGRDRALDDGPCTLLERRPDRNGLRIRSDRSTATDLAWRQAAVGRLFGLVMRAVGVAGREWVFESSGPDLWRRIRRRIGALLDRVHAAGGLRGVKSTDGYQVRCDRSTMSQADIDAGRLIVEILLRPAVPIEDIVIRLDVSPRQQTQAEVAP